MNGIYSCIIAVSMYSKIPMPTVEWTQERMRYVMCFFPAVGLAEGLLMGLWFYAGMDVFGLAPWTVALVGTAIPILVTGGIHMDGFMDTMDGLHSYGSREKKLEILKDPHLGAFAVISLAVYLLLYLAAAGEYALCLAAAPGETRKVLYMVPTLFFVTERALSGLSVVCFPPAKKDGLAAGFAQAAKKRTDTLVLILWLAACAVAVCAAGICGFPGAGYLAVTVGGVQLLVFLWYYRMSLSQFGGMTGDLAGCFLQICELASFGAVAVLLKSGALLHNLSTVFFVVDLPF